MAAKPWIVRVKTIDGGETTLHLQQDIYHTPVAELVKTACDKIGTSSIINIVACMPKGMLKNISTVVPG